MKRCPRCVASIYRCRITYPVFDSCPSQPITLRVQDPGISEPLLPMPAFYRLFFLFLQRLIVCFPYACLCFHRSPVKADLMASFWEYAIPIPFPSLPLSNFHILSSG